MAKGKRGPRPEAEPLEESKLDTEQVEERGRRLALMSAQARNIRERAKVDAGHRRAELKRLDAECSKLETEINSGVEMLPQRDMFAKREAGRGPAAEALTKINEAQPAGAPA